MSFRPHNFGRYTILDPIAVGGMAEIYRARLTNTGGDSPDRILIIKKVISALSGNQDFVEMFEGEIKITVGLSHPNIVQIFDYGRVDGVSFLAMEYVEGKNLRQFLKRLISMKSMFSIDMSCYIVSQVCNALAYAHAFKDRMSGEHLGIVHRDVSPQNVMISYDGAVKLFDFGIAKAKSASEATQAGVIKGKPSYLSPEQIAGEVLDGRSDVFSLGIVLWEMLTAKRLFVADNDMAILRMIQSAKIEPPSTYNPAIPQALDAIVLRSLARDRDKRYRTAEEMQRDLHRFLYSYNPGFNPADLSYYATELFKKEIQEDRERLRAALKITPDPQGPQATGRTAESGTGSAANSAPSKPSKSTAEGLMSSNEFNRDVMEDMMSSMPSARVNGPDPLEIEINAMNPAAESASAARSGKTSSRNTPPATPGSGTKPAASGTRGDLVIPPWVNQASKQSASRRINNTTSLSDGVVRRGRPRPGSRSIAIEREISQNGMSASRAPSLVALLVILVLVPVLGAKFMPEAFEGVLADTPLEFLLASRKVASVDSPKVASPAVRPAPASTTPAGGAPGEAVVKIRIDSNEPGFAVVINGRPMSVVDNTVEAPLGIDLNIEISKPGFDPKVITTKLTSPEPRALTVELRKIEKGYLTFFTNPGADVTLRSPGRKPASLFTPIRKLELPAGEYEATIENTRINHRSTLKFKIETGKLTTIEKEL